MFLGTFVARLVMSVVGYLYPAYSCYIALQELNAERMVLWCKFWCIMGCLSAAMPIVDIFLFWFPFYNEMKLVFVVFLWYPGKHAGLCLKGTDYVWGSYVEPYMAAHREVFDQTVAASQGWLTSVFGQQAAWVASAAQAKAMAALTGLTGERSVHGQTYGSGEAASQAATASSSARPSEGAEVGAAATWAAAPQASPPAKHAGRIAPLQDLIDSVWSFD
ncbi:hypothetical protein APUTEX25_004665 [Auxenochlorella protothecoides]|uniref:HVA22-like protein n=1 Tax=Auxenochlorella protothecoides TaxID=3075 RepID=A0A3M7L4H6_AUXPR|nr:hypothetical protein APUTEX25_004665 [Auxenochlorella protothecoides]|eukprot:RMZ56442.1 hypothetical protein APUTEX25_004665 [Auxenochlorella protothecoides]